MGMGSTRDLAEAFEARGWAVREYWDVPTSIVQREMPPGPAVLLIVSDDDTPLEVPDGVWAFRTSLTRSLRTPRELVLPYVFEPVGVFEPLPKGRKPRVGFCGFWTSHPARAACIRALLSCPDIDARFVLKTVFWGGNPHDPAVVRDFVENMEACEFNLCVRGRGNFSMRFYQTLCAGRIPVVLDTDMVWPFEDEIPWDDVCVRVSRAEDMPAAIAAFWASKDVEAVQRECARVGREYFGVATAGPRLLRCIDPAAAS